MCTFWWRKQKILKTMITNYDVWREDQLVYSLTWACFIAMVILGDDMACRCLQQHEQMKLKWQTLPIVTRVGTFFLLHQSSFKTILPRWVRPFSCTGIKISSSQNIDWKNRKEGINSPVPSECPASSRIYSTTILLGEECCWGFSIPGFHCLNLTSFKVWCDWRRKQSLEPFQEREKWECKLQTSSRDIFFCFLSVFFVIKSLEF